MNTRTRLAALLALATLFGGLCAAPARAQFARTFDPSPGPATNGSGPAAFTVDPAGNAVVVGTLYTDSGSATQVVKYDTHGAIVWRHSYSRPFNENTATAVSTDAAGNVYVAGTALADTTYNQKGFIVIKYSPSGARLWAHIGQGTDPPFDGGTANTLVVPVAVKSDNAGGVYVVGYSPTGVVFGNVDGGRWSISKLNASIGYGVWNRNVVGTAPVAMGAYNNRPSSLAIDSAGNIAVCGTVHDASDGGRYDLLTVEYAPNGDVRWKHTERAPGQNTFSSKLIVDAADNVYAAGAFNDPSGNAVPAVVTASYTSAGAVRWLTTRGSSQAPIATTGIALASYGNVVVGLSGDFGGLSAEEYYYDEATGAPDDGGAGGPFGTFRAFTLDSSNNIIGVSDGHGGGALTDRNDFFTQTPFGNFRYRGPVPGYGTPIGVGVDAANNVYVCGSTALFLNPDGTPHLGWALVKYAP